MCGSGNLASAETAQKNTASTLSSDFNAAFKGNQNILAQIAPSLEGIIAKGVGQAGYSPEEDAARKTNILETNAAATRQASNVTGEKLGAMGDPTLASGSRAAITGNIAEQGALNTSNELSQETAQNYETGRENYFKASGELPGAASTLENATNGLAGDVNSAESGVASTEDARINATRAWISPLTSIITGGEQAAGTAIAGHK